jgi:hypothetical protein
VETKCLTSGTMQGKERRMVAKGLFRATAVARASMLAATVPASSVRPQRFLRCSKLLLGVCLTSLAASLVFGDFAFADNMRYYVDAAGGNDSNSGTSTTSPWRTIARANALNLEPGDRLLFRGGQTLSGNLLLEPEDAGTAASPVNVGSYDTGRARISAGVRIINVSAHDNADAGIESFGSFSPRASGWAHENDDEGSSLGTTLAASLAILVVCAGSLAVFVMLRRH